MNPINELVDSFQSELADLPTTFQEGDEVVAKVTPMISKLLAEANEVKTEVDTMIVQRDNLKKGIKDLSDNIMILANETTRPFSREHKQEVSEADSVRQLLKQTQGRSLF